METASQVKRQRYQPGVRLALRIGRRRAIATRDWDAARAYGRAFRDRDIQDEILERLIDSRSEDIGDLAIGDGTFLDWLVDNLPAILEMIKTIIDAFK